LPPQQAQFMEQVFFAYADQRAADALDIHLGVSSLPWTSDLMSAWWRFVLGIHLRHPDAMPELRAAGTPFGRPAERIIRHATKRYNQPGDPPIFDEMLAQRDPLTPVKMHVISSSWRSTTRSSARISTR
jgi:hypothetical protein